MPLNLADNCQTVNDALVSVASPILIWAHGSPPAPCRLPARRLVLFAEPSLPQFCSLPYKHLRYSFCKWRQIIKVSSFKICSYKLCYILPYSCLFLYEVNRIFGVGLFDGFYDC